MQKILLEIMKIIWINILPVIFACFFEIKKKKKECERLNDFFS